MHRRFKTIPAASLALLLAAGTAAIAQQNSSTQSIADVDQIPGNVTIIQQNGNTNTATIEQQAILGASYANAASIQQNGTGGSASVSQQGQQNAAGILQNGIGDKAAVQQNGSNLGVQINQYSNGLSATVTQFGTGTPNGPPISIKQF